MIMTRSLATLWVCGFLAAAATVPAHAQIVDEMRAIAPRSQPGPNAGMMMRDVPVGQVQGAWTDARPADGQVAPGILVWPYDRLQALPIRVRSNMWSTIVLPPWEEIEEYYLGDSRFFEVRTGERRRNVLLIRPIAAVETDTSLTVTGRTRGMSAPAWYTFYLRSESVDSARITDITVFVTADDNDGVRSVTPSSWSHSGATELARAMSSSAPAASATRSASDLPEPDPGAGKTEEEAQWLREIPFDPSKWDFDDYRVLAETEEAGSIAPVRVWHDGVFTYLDFGEGRADIIQRPVVMRVVDEVDNPVNTRTVGKSGEILVVESVGRTLTLRNGQRIVCLVWNEASPVSHSPITEVR